MTWPVEPFLQVDLSRGSIRRIMVCLSGLLLEGVFVSKRSIRVSQDGFSGWRCMQNHDPGSITAMLSFCPAAQMATVISMVGPKQTQIISGCFHQLIGQFLIAMNQFQHGGIAVAKWGFGQPNAA